MPTSEVALNQESTTVQRHVDTRGSISIIICCHNGEARLPITLEHVAGQKVPTDLAWEVIVVDNASTDRTSVVVEEFSKKHREVACRVVMEAKPGQTYARQCGARLACYKNLVFVDDDNWLDAEYIARLASCLQEHPEIGAVGGISTAYTETPEPAWFQRHKGWYAVNGPAEVAEKMEEVGFLWGACLAVRRDLFMRAQALEIGKRLTGRKGQHLQAGEDHELCHLLRALGAKLVINHSLRFQHYLPARRLTWKYLRDLHYAAGQVSVHLDLYRFGPRKGSKAITWITPLQRSWKMQLCYVSFKLSRNPWLLFLFSKGDLEGDDRALLLELYKGRLAALWQLKNTYLGCPGWSGERFKSESLSW